MDRRLLALLSLLRMVVTNGSLELDGIDDTITCGNDNSLRITGSYCVSFWVYPIEQKLSAMYLQSKYHPGQAIELLADRKIRLMSQNTDNVDVIDFQADSYEINKWNYIAGVWNGSKGYLYRNGVEIGNQDALVENKVLNTSEYLIYMASLRADSRYYKGVFAFPRVYSRAPSSTEIAQFYRGIFLNNANLELAYDFRTQTGATVFDQSANSNDGTITGATWSRKAPQIVVPSISHGSIV